MPPSNVTTGSSASAYSTSSSSSWRTYDREHLESLQRFHSIERNQRAAKLRARLESLRQPTRSYVRYTPFSSSDPGSSELSEARDSNANATRSGITTVDTVYPVPRERACWLRRIELDRLECILSDELDRIEEEEEHERKYGFVSLMELRDAPPEEADGRYRASSQNKGYSAFGPVGPDGYMRRVQIQNPNPMMYPYILSVIDVLEDDTTCSVSSLSSSTRYTDTTTSSDSAFSRYYPKWGPTPPQQQSQRQPQPPTQSYIARFSPFGAFGFSLPFASSFSRKASTTPASSTSGPPARPSLLRGHSAPASTQTTSVSSHAASFYPIRPHGYPSSSSGCDANPHGCTASAHRPRRKPGDPLLPLSSMGGQRLHRSIQATRPRASDST